MRVTSTTASSLTPSRLPLEITTPAFLTHFSRYSFLRSASTDATALVPNTPPPPPVALLPPSVSSTPVSPLTAASASANTLGHLPPQNMPDVLHTRMHQRRLLRDFPTRRHSSNISAELRRAALQGIMTPPVGATAGSVGADSEIAVEDVEERTNANKRVRRECNEDEPLQFDVVYEDGGHYSPDYSIGNILRDDGLVYCSSRKGNINILMRFKDPYRTSMDTACVITKLVVKSPVQGFTAPCKEGLMFVSHDPIPVEATSQFDDFTQGDYEEYTTRHGHETDDGCQPAAFFRMARGSRGSHFGTEVELNHRSGKYVLIKLLRAEGDSENIDLQYIGFIGYTGARSFAHGTLC